MKNFAIAVLLVLCLSLAVRSQDAQVMSISDQDAKLVKRTYEEKLEADKAWDQLVLRMRDKYTGHDPNTGGCGNYHCGWENGIVFSSDFKNIVPETKHISINPCGGQYFLNSGPTPAIQLLPNFPH